MPEQHAKKSYDKRTTELARAMDEELKARHNRRRIHRTLQLELGQRAFVALTKQNDKTAKKEEK